MTGIQLKKIYSENDIIDSLSFCADSLYNQEYNDIDYLKTLARKYYKNGICYTVSVNGIIAGFAACYVNDNEYRIGFLSIIVVRGGYQGLGLGSLLLDVVIAICKQYNMQELRLEVDSTNDSAIRFYSNRDFEVVEHSSKNLLILRKQFA